MTKIYLLKIANSDQYFWKREADETYFSDITEAKIFVSYESAKNTATLLEIGCNLDLEIIPMVNLNLVVEAVETALDICKE